MVSLFRQSEAKSATDDRFGYFPYLKDRIKPHFVNNILTAIYYLSDSDPEKAQAVTMNMSGYMTGVLGLIETQDQVSFSTELDLVRNYLSLEKLRFEDNLSVTYDIAVDDFNIPPVTVQPLVENSVKRGIAEKRAPGTIQIVTRKMADGSIQIRVIDDGVGFDTSILEKNRTELVDQMDRIKKETGGELTVESTPGKGTTATITLPPR